MSWLSDIFLNTAKKGTITAKNKEQINTLVMVAALENRLEPSDIKLLTEQVSFIRYTEPSDKEHRIRSYRKSLPKNPREIFTIIFHLVMSLMRNGSLSEKKEEMLIKIIQIIHLRKEKSRDLISYIKSNIRNGLNVDESYLRLGYLVERSSHYN